MVARDERKEGESPNAVDLARRVEELEKDSRRKWQYITTMRAEFRERLSSIETNLKHLCHAVERFEGMFDRFRQNGDGNGNGNGISTAKQILTYDQQRRFERLWGVIQLIGWVMLVAATSGIVLSAFQHYVFNGVA